MIEDRFRAEPLAVIWQALQGTGRPAPNADLDDRLAAFVAHGEASYIGMGDVLVDMDSRIETPIVRDALYEALEVRWDEHLRKPDLDDPDDRGASVRQTLSPAAFCHLMIGVERLGFNVSPMRLAKLITPTVRPRRGEVDQHEFIVLQYGHPRWQPGRLVLDTGMDSPAAGERTITTATGYRVTLRHAADGTPLRLTSDPPRPLNR